MSRLLLAVVSVCLLGGVADAQYKTPVRNLAQKCFGPNCQAQSTGFFVVGQRDSLGDVITSVGPVVDPVPSMAPVLPQAEVSIMAVGDRARLMRVMLAAARAAKASGASVEEIKSAMVDAALETLAASSQAIDIDKWIEIIEKLIPLILKLIDLLGASTHGLNEVQYAFKSLCIDPVTVCDWSGLAA